MKIAQALLLLSVVLFSGCVAVQSINDIKTDELIGETVSVRGVVAERIILGEISGFVIKDSYNDTIFISSESLPAEGETVTVTGILDKKLLIGYYITQE
ncbi:MAG: hypothetical protein PHT91_02640 [Candidatus Nanoarchaeia archaeon]|nr:hypothetical protein [Candidatus Nanoarchaeia archaeon]MDD5054517.1 hypothetical protein [Candidatus Nanoarchaeia archaeon]MDD5499748.1 hypothetical protein [Candidatus Nanoarchaeia archaeon]